MRIKRSRLIVTALLITTFIGIGTPALFAADATILKAGDKILVEFKGEGTVIIQGNEFEYKRLKKDKRLRIIDKNSREGVFFKRYGTKIRLRDLKGNLLHFIRKTGSFYKVKTMMGTELAVIKIENGEVDVTNRDSNSAFRIAPENGNILFRDKNGTTVFTLEGETNPFPASFFALTPLSLVERVACYLTYR